MSDTKKRTGGAIAGVPKLQLHTIHGLLLLGLFATAGTDISYRNFAVVTA